MSTIAKKRHFNFHSAIHDVTAFIKRSAVLCIAILAAVITSFFVPPDVEYLNYFDYKTLTCLFCVLAVVCALKNVKFFTVLATQIVKIFKTTRSSILALIYVTFIGSMFIANDMALLTFLPLGYFILTSTGKQNLMAFTFIMQNIAAAHTDKNCVVIGISHSGASRDIVQAMQIAKQNGATTVAITNIDKSPIDKVSDVVFYGFRRNEL